MLSTRSRLALTALMSSILLATGVKADNGLPVLTEADRARLRALLAQQAQAETRSPRIINQIREQLRTGAQQG